MGNFVDHYSVLQVHPEAEQEVVQGAYKRLCKKYHPDLNASPQAQTRIAAINAAYEVLGDAERRAAYHAEWLRRRAVVPVKPPAPAQPAAQTGTPQARQLVHDYFSHLSTGRYQEAFALVSETDKTHFSFGDFVEWQTSVSATYELGPFSLSLYKVHPGFRMENRTRFLAEEYRVTVQEKNRKTGGVTEYAFTKYAVLERNTWRLYLGYRDLTPLMAHFKVDSLTQEESLLLSRWERYLKTTNTLLGLPNRHGFEEMLAPEIYRYKRYARPFTLAAFQVVLPDRVAGAGQAARLLKYVGYLLSHYVRSIDRVGYLDERLFGVLFAETPWRAAESAARRILRAVRKDLSSCFDFDVHIQFGLAAYEGQSLDSLLRACLRNHRADIAGRVVRFFD
ncbi:MAG: DnaJ domain-containing protein [Oscillospiraceae bacterium]|nr:DnaJ domain-containing protein [Oscillospiraceae bacterium]